MIEGVSQSCRSENVSAGQTRFLCGPKAGVRKRVAMKAFLRGKGAPMDPVVQEVLKTQYRLQLVQRIGRGGFGEVW
jgi:hypothetical protein